MALRILMLKRSIDKKKEELELLRSKDSEFETREAELEAAINEAETPEQEQAVSEEVEKFDADKSAHEEAKSALSREIEGLEADLSALEADAPKLDEIKPNQKERTVNHMTEINIRSLPMNQRAFDALSMEQRKTIVERDDIKDFLTQLRSMKGQQRAISGAELTIPVVFLDLISENMYRYSKLLNRVRVRNVTGEARQTIAGTVPEAVWTEMCGAINELSFVFNQVTLDGYMVSSSALDTYLQTLIASAKDYISTEGITLADSQSDGMLVEMYAAYLYRRRREENVQMPRMLRWALNNRLFSEKGAVNG